MLPTHYGSVGCLGLYTREKEAPSLAVAEQKLWIAMFHCFGTTSKTRSPLWEMGTVSTGPQDPFVGGRRRRMGGPWRIMSVYVCGIQLRVRQLGSKACFLSSWSNQIPSASETVDVYIAKGR